MNFKNLQNFKQYLLFNKYNIIDNIFGKYLLYNNKTNNTQFLRLYKYNDDGIFKTNINATQKYIGGFTILSFEDKIKVDYININNQFYKDNYALLNETPISKDDNLFIQSLFHNYIEKYTKDKFKNKIELDVYKNLKLYKHEYQKYNYKLTNKKCVDNPDWIITEKNIK